MSSFQLFAAGVLQAESVPNDGLGSTSLSPYFAPIYEVIIGGIATLIVFGLLYKFAWPSISASMKDDFVEFMANDMADLDYEILADS